ncbi:MAG: potassium channel protein [Bacteroidota bacterium]
MRNYVRNFYIAVFLLLVTLTIGIIGYIFLEDYSLNQAFYMTIITLSTVGFSEVRELSDQGRIFTSFLILFNLGIFAYAISNISSFFIEGDWQRLIKDYRVLTKVDKLQNHVIVCGFGRHGRQVLDELTSQQIPFVLIEKDGEKLDVLRDKGDILFVEGDATNDDLLAEAGVDQAKALIVTLSDETENLYVVLSARQMSPDLTIISRAINPKAEKKLRSAGASHVVMPEKIGGFYMAQLVDQPETVEFFNILSNMGRAHVMFREYQCEQLNADFLGHTIRHLDLRDRTGANIIGIRYHNGDYDVNPGPDTMLDSDMILVVLGDQEQLATFEEIALR